MGTEGGIWGWGWGVAFFGVLGLDWIEGLMALGSDFCCRDLEDMICGGYYDSI